MNEYLDNPLIFFGTIFAMFIVLILGLAIINPPVEKKPKPYCEVLLANSTNHPDEGVLRRSSSLYKEYCKDFDPTKAVN